MERNIGNSNSLKGKDQVNRIQELMGKVSPNINESKNNAVLEISKKADDGKHYGVVRENHEYFIKVAEGENPTVNDYQYIGGLQNKRDFVFESYAKATKQLKLKFISISEAYGVEHDVDTNVLLKENPMGGGFNSMGTGFAKDVFDKEDNPFREEYVEDDFSEEMVDRANDADYSRAFDAMEDDTEEVGMEDMENHEDESRILGFMRELQADYGDLTLNQLLELMTDDSGDELGECSECNENIKKKV